MVYNRGMNEDFGNLMNMLSEDARFALQRRTFLVNVIIEGM